MRRPASPASDAGGVVDYVAMFGVGGVLTIALGIHDRREIWQAPPAAFIIKAGQGQTQFPQLLALPHTRVRSLVGSCAKSV